MSVAIDIILLVFLALGTYMGYRKGLIKTAVQLIGLIAIIIISYALRTPLTEFMIDNLPFVNFAGFEGLTALNILVYNVIAFLIIFILLYCLLSIVIALTGFIDTLLKLTVIWVLPSKIGGALLGFIEAWVFLLLVLFVAGSFNVTANYVQDSTVSRVMIDHTPVVGRFLSGVTQSAKEIYAEIKTTSDSKSTQELNLKLLQIQISYRLISKEKAQELVDTGKIDVGDVLFGAKENKWLSI